MLPSAEALALFALLLLATGWLLATVAPRLAGGIALGALPGVAYATFLLESTDHARATGLLGTVAALTGLGIGCALQASKDPRTPGQRRQRAAPRPRVPRAARH